MAINKLIMTMHIVHAIPGITDYILSLAPLMTP
jgi:hypothetical protein